MRWVSDAPDGWRSEDDRFRIWATRHSNSQTILWALTDRGEVVLPPSGDIGFERVTQAKLTAETRVLREG